MALNYDLLLVGNDLFIDPIGGDFMVAQSDEQHIIDNINAFPGWWKENPVDGVGAFAYLNSSGQEQVLARNIKQQLQADGYQCNNPQISYDGKNLIIDPNATKV